MFPWATAAKYGGLVGVGVLLLTIGYIKGDGDRNSKWLKAENTRIQSESNAQLLALGEAHKLDLDSAKKSADALARADEKAKAAKDRADNAEKSRNATRRKNNALYSDLKKAQDAAADAGDLAGRGLMPPGVRKQTADRLNKICGRRSTECRASSESGSEIQKSPTVRNADKNLAGGYPAPSK